MSIDNEIFPLEVFYLVFFATAPLTADANAPNE